jgi:hypothetical protein
LGGPDFYPPVIRQQVGGLYVVDFAWLFGLLSIVSATIRQLIRQLFYPPMTLADRPKKRPLAGG